MNLPPLLPCCTASTSTHEQLQQSALNEAQCHLILMVGLAYARRHGLQEEDGEDQALAFLLHLLLYLQNHPHTDRSVILSAVWLARSADNWIRSFLRVERRRQHREVGWPASASGSGEAPSSLEMPSNAPLPCTEAIRAEFCRRIRDAITAAQLTNAQYELLVLVLQGERAVDIATHLQRPPDTIRQRLRTLRLRLRKILEVCDLGDVEIREYLSVLGL